MEQGGDEPRPLAWAGMKDAVGVNTRAMEFWGVSDRILPRIEQTDCWEPPKDVGNDKG